MIRPINGVMLATIFAAGCASAPERASGPSAAPPPAAVSAQAPQQDVVATGVGAEAAAAAPAVTGAAAAEATTAQAVVEASELTQNAGSIVTCRDVLITGSNVMTMRCMTRDDWERFAHMQMLEAQEMLRKMQGSAFPR